MAQGNVYYLRQDEVAYELRIRGLDESGNAETRRARLSQALVSKTELKPEVIATLSAEEEIDICEDKANHLLNLVKGLKETARDSDIKRLSIRSAHLRDRITRIPVEEGDPLKDSQLSLISKSDEIEDALRVVKGEQPVSPRRRIPVRRPLNTEEESDGVAELDQDDVPTGNRRIHRDNGAPTKGKSTAATILKWNVKFSNSPGENVVNFIEKVNELSLAHGVSEESLFSAAVVLFEGEALTWFRGNRHRIFTWKNLCQELKFVFLDHEYDEWLLERIRSRKQLDREPIDIFLAVIEEWCERLTCPISEQEQFKIVRRNLNNYLREKLCMTTINSVEELRRYARLAETGLPRKDTPVSTPHSTPPTRYRESTRDRKDHLGRDGRTQERSHYRDSNRSSWPRPVRKCFTCGSPEHIAANCGRTNTQSQRKN